MSLKVDGHKRHKDVLKTNKRHGQLLKTGNNHIWTIFGAAFKILKQSVAVRVVEFFSRIGIQ